MDISLVLVEDGITNIGFRKLAGYVNKELNLSPNIYFAADCDNYHTYLNMLYGTVGEPPSRDQNWARNVANQLADSDVIGFSSMSPYAGATKKIINHVRSLNPDAFIIWGGIHPIVDPEDAIQHADAICTGEGEFAFEEFLTKYQAGKDYTDTKNFWFNRDGKIIRNPQRPLMTNEELDNLPLLQYGENESILDDSGDFIPLTADRYRSFHNLAYHAIWSIGCPLHCTFCANTKFIENNSDYTQVRHPTPSYLIDEIEQALAVHPHISSVIIQDDSLMGLHPDTLRALGKEWKKRLDVPFTVLGVIPNYVTEEKIEILLDAGMNRLRMGIQSGSQEMLDFYKRPTPPEKILKAAKIIKKYQKYMIPPAYDIIVDNPVENVKNVQDNIKLLRKLPRPYNLNVLSLTSIPGTELEDQLEERNLTICTVRDGTFADVSNTLANCLIYLVGTIPMPNWLFNFLLERSKPAHESNESYAILLFLSRMIHYFKRGLHNLSFFEFSYVGGNIGYFFWYIGLLDRLRDLLTPDFELDNNDSSRTTPVEKPTSVPDSKTAQKR